MSGTSSGPFTLSSTAFTANTECKALYITDGVETWANVKSVTTNDSTHFPCSKLTGGNAKMNTAGNYTLTVTKSGDEWIYAFVCNDFANAETFASNFNTHIAAKCDEHGGTNIGQLTTQWGTEATTYNGLDSYVKGWLASNNPGSSSTITAMFAKYDYVYGKYGSTIGTDFLGRKPSPRGSSAITGFSPFYLLGEDGSNLPIVIIIVASSVSLLSITALSVLMVKKCKRKEQ